MADRYFVESPILGEHASLTGPEAHHLLHVMRAKPGLEVVLFDGSGRQWRASVAQLGRSTVELQVLAAEEVDRELPRPLVLGVALPKGDRQKWLVEKAVELGVTRLVPLVTERSVAEPVDKARQRLQRGVIEASKQCGRNRLMEIAEPQPWASFLASPLGEDRQAQECLTYGRWLAHPGTSHRPWTASATGPLAGIALAIGPEGGFTDAEVAAAQTADWQTVTLGPRILRIETAAILLAGLAAQVLEGSTNSSS